MAFRERHIFSACSQTLSSDHILHNSCSDIQFGSARGSQRRTALYLPIYQRTYDARNAPVRFTAFALDLAACAAETEAKWQAHQQEASHD